MGKEHNIAGGIILAGTYELDVQTSKIRLTPSWPKKPPSNWSYLLKDGGKTLILLPLEPQDGLEPQCGVHPCTLGIEMGHSGKRRSIGLC